METGLEERGTQSGVLDRLPFNLTQLLGFAMQKPRNAIKAMDNAIAQLRATPQFAAKAYYSIPFKRKDGTEEIVEGPSIKAATALTGCWGNNVEGGFVGEETDSYIDVSGYFFDYETGKLTIRPWRVSKTYRTAKGEVIKWRYDMLLKQIQAGVSKAIRNADLNGLPAGYVAEYYAEAKRIAARGGKIKTVETSVVDDVKAITDQITQCVQKFEALGVEAVEVNQHIARHPELTNEEQVAAYLVGLLSALEDGQTTIEEVFTVPDAPIAEPKRVEDPQTDWKPAIDPAKVAAAITRPVERKLDPNRRRMQNKIDKSMCPACRKPIKLGEWIYRNALGQWVHEASC